MAMKSRPALKMTVPDRAEAPAEKTGPVGKMSARAGKVQLGAYIAPEAKRQLDVFAAMNGRTIQSLVEEMMDDFFAKHGMHRLAVQDAGA